METLTFNGIQYTVDHAVKGTDYIHAYDAAGVLVVAFDGVTDFSGFTYSGEYMEPAMCLADPKNTLKICKEVNARGIEQTLLKTQGGETISMTDIGALPAKESSTHPGCFYNTLSDGTTEWINPPMVLDTEYRTTERYKGKPVYAKLVYLDTMPNEACKTVSHGISNIEDVIEARGSARTTDGAAIFLPSSAGSLETAWNIGVTENVIFVVTNANRTNWRGSVLIKVIKTTD